MLEEQAAQMTRADPEDVAERVDGVLIEEAAVDQPQRARHRRRRRPATPGYAREEPAVRKRRDSGASRAYRTVV